MKRVIKFKAWHERLQMMFTVYSIDFDKGLVFCESENDTRHTFGMIDVELLQLTEIEDRNGGDIYDGDISAFFDMEAYEIEREESGRWMLKGLYEELDDRKTEVLVIGNIYENPGMLGR